MDKELRHTPELTDGNTLRRFMMTLSYDGAPYKGWQIQPNDPSVQESIESALRTALRTTLHIVGAGRTDTGVNARHMTAHFDLPADKAQYLEDNTRNVLYTINAILRPAIVVHDFMTVNPNHHARFDATSRTYRYYVHTVGDPFVNDKSRYLHTTPDFENMNAAAARLLGTHDFTSFSKLHTDTKTNICTVSAASWHQYAPGHYYFEITADRFLRNMVRAIVGTLFEIGTGRRSVDSIDSTLAAMDRCAAGASVPGYALYLWQITYPYPLPQVPLP